DDSAGLASCAIRMLRDPEAARRMAAAGRAELEARYVWSVVGPSWLATYRRMAGRNARAT
ncbi:MAG: glycosyl transferase family 1, partial [Gemmatirosa sp.]